MAFMAYMLVAVDASILGRLGPGKRSQMGLSCSGARWLGQQAVVAMEAPLARYMFEYLLAYLLDVVLTAKDMLNPILGALIRLGGEVGKESVLWRQVTINALDAEAEFVGAVRGQLPGLERRVHLVAHSAAELAF